MSSSFSVSQKKNEEKLWWWYKMAVVVVVIVGGVDWGRSSQDIYDRGGKLLRRIK